MIVVPSVEPPPTMTSVPLAGPYSGGAALAAVAAAAGAWNAVNVAAPARRQ